MMIPGMNRLFQLPMAGTAMGMPPAAAQPIVSQPAPTPEVAPVANTAASGASGVIQMGAGNFLPNYGKLFNAQPNSAAVAQKQQFNSGVTIGDQTSPYKQFAAVGNIFTPGYNSLSKRLRNYGIQPL